TSGGTISGDDSGGSATPILAASETSTQVLADGTRVRWNRGPAPIAASVPMILQFDIEDRDGKPARDLTPYMGMAAHAVIVRNDLTVFAHVHPSGSVPMASLMMVSGDNASAPMPQMSTMPAMTVNAAQRQNVSSHISVPYGFPKPGLYRIYLQFRRAGQVE